MRILPYVKPGRPCKVQRYLIEIPRDEVEAILEAHLEKTYPHLIIEDCPTPDLDYGYGGCCCTYASFEGYDYMAKERKPKDGTN